MLLWKNSIEVEVISSSPNHIDAVVGANPRDQWRFTGVYGFADSSRKQETWSLLRGLHRGVSLPWLCVGDFNEILWSHEKFGLGPRQECKMRDFRDVLDECGLMDLGFIGEKFTWRGKRSGGLVLERIDRATASNGWFSRFPGTKVHHLPTHSSDHKAILIKLDGITPRQNHYFKFEQMWLREDGCKATVIKVWGPSSQDTNMLQVARKIKICGEKLTSWSFQSFGSVKQQVDKLSKLLSKAEVEVAKGTLGYEKVSALKSELSDLLDKESQMWQQRSRALFLQCGDRNTSYFHSKASHRSRRNRISGLRDASNGWCTLDSEIRKIACEYYQSLFTSSHPLDFSRILEAVKPSVSESMNAQLLCPFLREEVEVAVNQMKAISAPGPDGMPP